MNKVEKQVLSPSSSPKPERKGSLISKSEAALAINARFIIKSFVSRWKIEHRFRKQKAATKITSIFLMRKAQLFKKNVLEYSYNSIRRLMISYLIRKRFLYARKQVIKIQASYRKFRSQQLLFILQAQKSDPIFNIYCRLSPGVRPNLSLASGVNMFGSVNYQTFIKWQGCQNLIKAQLSNPLLIQIAFQMFKYQSTNLDKQLVQGQNDDNDHFVDLQQFSEILGYLEDQSSSFNFYSTNKRKPFFSQVQESKKLLNLDPNHTFYRYLMEEIKNDFIRNGDDYSHICFERKLGNSSKQLASTASNNTTSSLVEEDNSHYPQFLWKFQSTTRFFRLCNVIGNLVSSFDGLMRITSKRRFQHWIRVTNASYLKDEEEGEEEGHNDDNNGESHQIYDCEENLFSTEKTLLKSIGFDPSSFNYDSHEGDLVYQQMETLKGEKDMLCDVITNVHEIAYHHSSQSERHEGENTLLNDIQHRRKMRKLQLEERRVKKVNQQFRKSKTGVNNSVCDEENDEEDIYEKFQPNPMQIMAVGYLIDTLNKIYLEKKVEGAFATIQSNQFHMRNSQEEDSIYSSNTISGGCEEKKFEVGNVQDDLENFQLSGSFMNESEIQQRYPITNLNHLKCIQSQHLLQSDSNHQISSIKNCQNIELSEDGEILVTSNSTGTLGIWIYDNEGDGPMEWLLCQELSVHSVPIRMIKFLTIKEENYENTKNSSMNNQGSSS